MGTCCFKKQLQTSESDEAFIGDIRDKPILSPSKPQNNIKNEISPQSYPKMSFSDFQPISLIGTGSFGQVYLVRKISDYKLYALKVLQKNLLKEMKQETHTKTERLLLEKANSKFIVRLYYAFQDELKLYLATEFMQGGDLFFHLRKDTYFSNDRAKFYAAEITLALVTLHQKNIIYRDLKPENVLLDKKGHLKLADFGLSIILGTKKDEKAYTLCGTPQYLAPEVLEFSGYDKAVDWWSLGVLIYEMLSGKYPFIVPSDRLPDLSSFKEKPDIPSNFTEDAKDIIYSFLEFDPKRRLGYGDNEMEEIKKMKFFDGIDWDGLEKGRVKTPFIPQLKDETDVRYFDKEFTECNLMESLTLLKSNRVSNRFGSIYEGFTYENKLLDNNEIVEEEKSNK